MLLAEISGEKMYLVIRKQVLDFLDQTYIKANVRFSEDDIDFDFGDRTRSLLATYKKERVMALMKAIIVAIAKYVQNKSTS